MAERKEILNRFVQMGLSTQTGLRAVGMARSTYYYKPRAGKKGRIKSTYTLHCDGQVYSNEQIVALIKSICEEPFIDYGSDRVALELRNRGYIINRKKVYRLMKENQLLYPKRRRIKRPEKHYVKFTVPKPTKPFEIIEIDIKYVYIDGERRNAYLLTALDTFTRMAMNWRLDYHMRSVQVAELVKGLMNTFDRLHYTERFVLRSDNGPQFISHELKQELAHLPYQHEFIRPGTPEQNAHIESFHNTIANLLLKQHHFKDLEHARQILGEFYQVYNNKRIMKAILGKSPVGFYNLWNQDLIGSKEVNGRTRFFFREKPGKTPGSSPEDLHWSYQNNNIYPHQLTKH